jgi:hypothetical protein
MMLWTAPAQIIVLVILVLGGLVATMVIVGMADLDSAAFSAWY